MTEIETKVATESEPKKGKRKKGKKDEGDFGIKKYSVESTIESLAIKCYWEQIPGGLNALRENIRKIDKNKWQIIAIEHNRDYQTDDFWEPSLDKPHVHIFMRVVNGSPTKIRTVLNALGVEFRRGKDEYLVEHGLETCRNYSACALYATHETPQAIADGKERYQLEELISNLTIDEIKEIRAGYVRPSATRRATMDDLIALDKEAFDRGYQLKDFSTWYNELPFNIRSHCKMKTIRESFNRGIQSRIDKHIEIVRTCIYIQGEPQVGKTYTSTKALENMGIKYSDIYMVDNSGTGQYDRLKPTHKAIIIDDQTSSNMLKASDNYICRMHRRGSDDPIWTGEILVVTSNLEFKEWLHDCGFKNEDNIKAMVSRFFICKVEYLDTVKRYHLKLESHSTRGTAKERNQRYDNFNKFKNAFDEEYLTFDPFAQKKEDEDKAASCYNYNYFDETTSKEIDQKEAPAEEETEAQTNVYIQYDENLKDNTPKEKTPIEKLVEQFLDLNQGAIKDENVDHFCTNNNIADKEQFERKMMEMLLEPEVKFTDDEEELDFIC
jgi:hypothetical protein